MSPVIIPKSAIVFLTQRDMGPRHTFSEKRSGMNTQDMHRTNTHGSEIIMHLTNTHDRKRAYEILNY